MKSHPHDKNASTRSVHTRHQPRVDAQPGGERDVTVELVVVRPHLGDRRAVADHRHDPLVLVVERLPRRAGDGRRGCSGRPLPGLQGDGSELGQVVSVGTGDVGDVADRVYPGMALHGEVRPHGESAAAALWEAGGGGELRGLDATRPHHGVGEDLRSVAQRDAVGGDLLDAGAQTQDHAVLLQLRRGVRVGLVGEGAEHDRPEVDEVDAGACGVEVAERPRDHLC